ncbi:MAG: GlsB/YeaQ/YmgE family stress response membrane protein [Bacteroidales bacterium]|nr:GlsB/YeaQ/YmgE family stress response membrane protein [Bacteroidales bacterium]MDD7724308.1 GlsB/YeaQ/YmgE family stress response membrane protein [Bacteroidales bacterium]
MNIIVYIVIGAIVGWIAGKIMKSKMGVFGNIIVGIVGGGIGGWLLGDLLSGLGTLGGFITSVIGAVILLFIIKLIK